MPKVGVLLSGCGVFDGAEIHESVLTLLALDQKGATPVCCAPNTNQAAVIDHATQEPTSETRNILKESARIARGEIRDVATVKADELDALIMPGGLGAAKNLSNFAEKGTDCSIDPGVEKLVSDCLAAGKPVGAICIAPATLARIAANRGLKAKVTIGNDAATAQAITAMGCVHENQPVTEIALDAKHKIVTTPAYMLAPGPAAVYEGVRKLVDKVLELAAPA
ncbi:MAG: isoprenoid biosynthesis glyoxalase ElbB [Phycisphaerae bacterium]|nr:isoprenoid biosynthesis glyoxalase ElbB [Phycisphaerae bacterium]